MPTMNAYSISHAGPASFINEDCFLSSGYVPDSYAMELQSQLSQTHQTSVSSKQTLCFAVFSGSGKPETARVCAQFAADELKDEITRLLPLPVENVPSLFERYLHRVQRRLAVAAEHDLTLSDLGASISCLVMRNAKANIMAIGSCSAYLYRIGQLKKLAPSHHGQPVLPSRAPATVELFSTGPIDVRENDRFLLCTPGVVEKLGEDALSHFLEIDEAGGAAQQIVSQALERGAGRSATCAVIDWSVQEPRREWGKSLEEMEKTVPVMEHIEHKPKKLKVKLDLPEKEVKIGKERLNIWEHFPIWVGYFGLGLLVAVAVLLYFLLR